MWCVCPFAVSDMAAPSQADLMLGCVGEALHSSGSVHKISYQSYRAVDSDVSKINTRVAAITSIPSSGMVHSDAGGRRIFTLNSINSVI